MNKDSARAIGLFGAVYDFSTMPWFFRKTMSGLKPQLEASRARDIVAIQQWAQDLA